METWSFFYPSINFAIPNAAPAAIAPMSMTRNAPDQTLTPVILLLKKPKANRQISVTMAEIFNPSRGELTKK